MSRALGPVVVVMAFLSCGSMLLVGGWLLAGAGGARADCGGSGLQRSSVPVTLIPLFDGAARTYRLGAEGPAILAALTKIESGFGRNLGPSTAGAIGWTQFLPSTWRRFGVDADGDGIANPRSAPDAIHAAANYLRHLGAPKDWRRALFGYNHADWYVNEVLREAQRLASREAGDVLMCASEPRLPSNGVQRVFGGGQIVAVPGAPGERIDERLVADVVLIMRRYRVAVTDGYAATGHAPDGEHPLGLAIDVVPGAGGTWSDVDELAEWAEPRQGHPRPPFSWVGYDGDRGHGRGHHLHLSWEHGPATGRRPPARWVSVLVSGSIQ